MYWLVRVAHGKDKSIRVTYPTCSIFDTKEKFMKEYGDMIYKVWGHHVIKAKKINEKDYNTMLRTYGDRTPLFRALDMLRIYYKDRYGGFLIKVYRFWT